MALQGSIKDFGLADIFQLILHQRKTGSLVVKKPGQKLQVFFEDGMVIHAEPTNQDPLNRIGEKLVRTGRITKEQLQQALADQKNTQNHIGQILLNMGIISKKDLLAGLNVQVKETLYGLFRLTEGDYTFVPKEIEYDKSIWEPINTEFVLMEGMRRVDEWPLIEKAIPSYDIIFGKIPENAQKIQGVRDEDDEGLDDMFGEGPSEEGLYLTKDEMSVYEIIDGNRTVQGVIDSRSLGDFETCKVLNNLITAGLIQILKKPQSPTSSESTKIKVKTAPPRKSVFTRRNIGTFILYVGLLISIGVGYQNILNFGQQTNNLFKPYKNLMLDSQFQRISFAIQSYYFKFGELPKGLKEVSNTGLLDPDLLEDPWGNPIQYLSEGEGRRYKLLSKSNP